MKHILLFTAATIFSFGSFAQTCTPDGSFVGSAPGIYPLTPLEPTCDLIASKTIISLTDTLVTVTSPITLDVTVYIDALRINEVQGLPAGLTFETDVVAEPGAPYGVWYNTGASQNQTAALGCAFAYGSSGDWNALIGGGPNSDGIYPITFIVDARVESSSPNVSGLGLPNGSWISENPGLTGGAFVIEQTLTVPADYANISTSITGDGNVAPATQYTYSVPNDPNVTYNWTATNGTIDFGQGTNEVLVTWTGSGNIEVDLTDGGCQGTDNMDVTATATAIDEVAGINASVYPNPSNGIFNLRLESTDALNIKVMDITGKVVHATALAGSTLYNIDMQASKAGVYVMEIETAEGRTFKRLIKN